MGLNALASATVKLQTAQLWCCPKRALSVALCHFQPEVINLGISPKDNQTTWIWHERAAEH